MSKLNKLALTSLILNLLGYIPNWGHLFSVAGFSVGILVYRELEHLGLVAGAWKLFTAITLLSIVAVLLATFGFIYEDKPVLAISLSVIAYLIGLGAAWLTYKLAQRFRLTIIQTGAKNFAITAIMLKIAAFTMPLLIGFLIQGVAQLVFLVTAIFHKPNQSIAS